MSDACTTVCTQCGMKLPFGTPRCVRCKSRLGLPSCSGSCSKCKSGRKAENEKQ